MERGRLDRLTEQQRICLRHVHAHLTSKEIAPLLGIAPNSVDQHIKAAMRNLGVPDRRAAARLLAAHEGAAQPALALQEEQAPFDAGEPARKPLPLPVGGRKPTDLKPLQRLAWIFVLMLLIAFSFGVFLAGLEALSRLGRAASH